MIDGQWIDADWLGNDGLAKCASGSRRASPLQSVLGVFGNFQSHAIESICLAGVQSLRELQSSSPLLVRDGTIALRYFFQRFPEPSEVHSNLYIHEKCRAVCPKSWAKHISYYRLSPRKSSADTFRVAHPQPSQFLILAMNIRAYCEVEFAQQQLMSLRPYVVGKTVSVFLNTSDFYQAKFSEIIGVDQCAASFFEELLGARVQFITLNDLRAIHCFKDWAVFDLNDYALWADNHLVNLCLAKEADYINFELACTSLPVKRYPVSLKYELEIFAFENLEKFEPLTTQTNFAAEVELPWQDWNTQFRLQSEGSLHRAPVSHQILSMGPSRFTSNVLLAPDCSFVDHVSHHKDQCFISGWAIDKEFGEALQNIFLVQENRVINSRVNFFERSDVVLGKGLSSQAKNCGFELIFDAKKAESSKSVEIVGESPHGGLMLIAELDLENGVVFHRPTQGFSVSVRKNKSAIQVVDEFGTITDFVISEAQNSVISSFHTDIFNRQCEISGWVWNLQKQSAACGVLLWPLDKGEDAYFLRSGFYRKDLTVKLGPLAKYSGVWGKIKITSGTWVMYAIIADHELVSLGEVQL